MVAQVQVQSGANAKPRRRGRRLFGLLVSLLVVLVIAWGVFWYVAFRFANAYFGESATATTEGNAVVTCSDRELGGFPLRIRLGCVNAGTETDDGSRLSLASFLAVAPLYNPGWVEAQLQGPLVYDGVNHTINADWTAARVDLLAGFGGVNQTSTSLTNVDLAVTDRVDAAIWGATADAWTTEVRAAPGEADALRVLLSTSNLMIEIGDAVYPSLSGTATLTVLESGGRIDRLPDVMIGAWLASGGAFRIDDMALTSGNLKAEITGDAVLEIDGTLSGTVTLRYSGEEDLPQFLLAIFPWLGDNAGIIAEAFTALSQDIEMRGEPAHEVRLNVDHGAVKIGLIPIPQLTIPSIGPLDHFLPDPA